MIAEVFPEAYDANGRKVLRPDLRRRGLRSTAPMRRYVSQPLTVKCASLADVRSFLSTCRYVSDDEQFGKKDYWQPPEDFERTKKGDCDCFALWTWRQLLALGLNSRFVIGRAGRYGACHAWVQFSDGGKTFVVEPTAARFGNTIPRLSALRYRPRFSVAWDGENLSFYSHEERKSAPPFWRLVEALPEWLIYWSWLSVMVIVFLPRIIFRALVRGRKRTAQTPVKPR